MQAIKRAKKVMRATTPGAVIDFKESTMTPTHSAVGGPYAIDLEIPKSGVAHAPAQFMVFSN